MKHITTIALVLVLFALPLGSWYYLQQGYNFRKEALVKLEPKGEFMGLTDNIEGAAKIGEDIVMICLCKELSQEQEIILNEVEERYNSRGFTIIRLTGQEDEYKSLESKYNSDQLVLLDKDEEVRSSYTFSKEDTKDFIEHIAIILPFPKRKTVKLKREG